MNEEYIYQYLQGNIKYKLNQEKLTLARYYLFSSIFEIPQKDVIFYYPNNYTFSPIGLLHFSTKEILTNEIDLSKKLEQREILNKIYTHFIQGNTHTKLIELISNIYSKDETTLGFIRDLCSESQVDPALLLSLLKAEVEQLLRIFIYTEDIESLFNEFMKNIEIIKESNINNSNVRFYVCNFISSYLECINPAEFYKINNSITVAGITSGINLKVIKNKLDYYRSINAGSDYLLKKINYLIKLNSISKENFRNIFSSLSNLNQRDLDFLIEFSRTIFDSSVKEVKMKDLNVITDDKDFYELLDRLREEKILNNEITQFFTLTLKYQCNFLKYYEEFNVSLLQFIYDNGPILQILFSTFEGNVELEIDEDTRTQIISRIENKSKFIADVLNDFIAVPINFEIYNLKRSIELLDTVIELRSIISTPKDDSGLIINIIETSIEHSIIKKEDIQIENIIDIFSSDSNYIKHILDFINEKAVKAYLSIINGVFSTSNTYSILQVREKNLLDEKDILITINVKSLLENLRLIGYNNIFLSENIHFEEENLEVLTEYLNGGNVL